MNETLISILTTAGEGGGIIVVLVSILRGLYKKGVFKNVLDALGTDMTVSMKDWVIQHNGGMEERVIQDRRESEERTNKKMEEMEKRLEEHIYAVEKTTNENLAGARQDSIDRHELVKEEIAGLREDLFNEIEKLNKEVEYQINAAWMENARHLMFRFEEGILRGVEYTKDHWNSMYNLVQRYKGFSDDNDRFINSECQSAINLIEETWKTRPWEREK